MKLLGANRGAATALMLFALLAAFALQVHAALVFPTTGATLETGILGQKNGKRVTQNPNDLEVFTGLQGQIYMYDMGIITVGVVNMDDDKPENLRNTVKKPYVAGYYASYDTYNAFYSEFGTGATSIDDIFTNGFTTDKYGIFTFVKGKLHDAGKKRNVGESVVPEEISDELNKLHEEVRSVHNRAVQERGFLENIIKILTGDVIGGIIGLVNDFADLLSNLGIDLGDVPDAIIDFLNSVKNDPDIIKIINDVLIIGNPLTPLPDRYNAIIDVIKLLPPTALNTIENLLKVIFPNENTFQIIVLQGTVSGGGAQSNVCISYDTLYPYVTCAADGNCPRAAKDSLDAGGFSELTPLSGTGSSYLLATTTDLNSATIGLHCFNGIVVPPPSNPISPTFTWSPPTGLSINEGSSFLGSLLGSITFSDSDGNGVVPYTITVNFGIGAPVNFLVPGSPFTISQQSDVFTDNQANVQGTITISDNGGSADSTVNFSYDVLNVAPALSITTPAQSFPQGNSFSISGDFVDPGNEPSWALTIDWGIPSSTPYTNPSLTVRTFGPLTSPVYNKIGTYTVTVTVTDPQSGSSTKTLSVTVTDVLPVIDRVPNSVQIREGDKFTPSPTVLVIDNPNDGPYDLFIDWTGTSGFVQIINDQASTEFTLPESPNPYNNAGTYTLKIKVRDSNNVEVVGSFDVGVTNVPLIISSQPTDVTVNEGSPLVYSPGLVTWDDSSNDAPFSLTVQYGSETPLAVITGTTGFSATLQGGKVFDDGDSTVPVTLTLTNSDSETAIGTFNILVKNVAPTLALTSPKTVTINEGQTVSTGCSFTISDPANNNDAPFTVTAGWATPLQQTVNTVGVATKCAEPPALPDGPSTFNVLFSATDKDGASSPTDSLTVTVVNVKPTITGITGVPASINENSNIPAGTLSFTFTDPAGNLDAPFAVKVSWGLVSTFVDVAPCTDINAPCPLPASPVYPNNNTYKVRIYITDADGADSSIFTFDVVVKDVPPFFVGLGLPDVTINEGQNYTPGVQSFMFNDPAGAGDGPYLAYIQWSDTVLRTMSVSPNTFIKLPTSPAGTYPDGVAGDTVVTVSVVIKDKSNVASLPMTFKVTVKNVPPTLTIPAAISSFQITEGKQFSIADYEFPFSDPAGNFDKPFHFLLSDASTEDSFVSQQYYNDVNTPAKSTYSRFFEDGPFGINLRLRIIDKDGAQQTRSIVVSVVNVPAVFTSTLPSTPFTVTRGTALSGSVFGQFSFTDPAFDNDNYLVTVTWPNKAESFDLTPLGTTQVFSLPVMSVSNIFDNVGNFQGSVSIVDSDPNSPVSSLPFFVNVINSIKSFIDFPLDGTFEIFEGSRLDASAIPLITFTDNAPNGPYTARVSWDNRATWETIRSDIPIEQRSFSLPSSPIYPEGPLESRVYVQLFDKYNDMIEKSFNVKIGNLPPLPVLQSNSLINLLEGGAVNSETISFRFDDPGLLDSNFKVEIDWLSDGSWTTVKTLPVKPIRNSLITIAQRGPIAPNGPVDTVISIRVSDGQVNGVSQSITVAVHVDNVAPVIRLGRQSVVTINEGEFVAEGAIQVVIDDAGVLDSHSLFVDWLNDGVFVDITNQLSGLALNRAIPLPATGVYRDGPFDTKINIRVVDNDGAEAFVSADISVRNLSPSIITNMPDSFQTLYTVNEGQGLPQQVIYWKDAGLLDDFTVTISFNDQVTGRNIENSVPVAAYFDATPTATSTQGTSRLAFDLPLFLEGPSSTVITVTVHDKDGASSQFISVVRINNVAPFYLQDPLADAPVLSIGVEGTPARDFLWFEPSALDYQSIVVTWNDRSNTQLDPVFLVTPEEREQALAALNLLPNQKRAAASSSDYDLVNSGLLFFSKVPSHYYCGEGASSVQITVSDRQDNGATVVDIATQSSPSRPCGSGAECCKLLVDTSLYDPLCVYYTCAPSTSANSSCTMFFQTGSACEDGNPCTTRDYCSEGQCLSGSLSYDPVGNDCDDSDPCTQDDSCQPILDSFNSLIAVECKGDTVICEDDGNVCTEASCNKSSGLCEQKAVPCPSAPVVLPPIVDEEQQPSPSPSPDLLAPVVAITLPARPPLPDSIRFGGSSTPSHTPKASKDKKEALDTNNNVFYNKANNYGVAAFALVIMSACGCVGICVALITAHREDDRKDRLIDILDDVGAVNEDATFVESSLQ